MDFLRDCAARLDAGTPAELVLRDMSQRYSTVRCLNVKTCLVRNLCRPTDEYLSSLAGLCEAHPDMRDELTNPTRAGKDARRLLWSLPPKWDENVRRLKVTRAQMIECKRLGAQSAILKNQRKVRVNGCEMLDHARSILRGCAEQRFSDVALALMLVTGRRTCEVLNGRSVFERVNGETHALRFQGMAKRRGRGEVIEIPILAHVDDVLRSVDEIRLRQKKRTLANRETSRRYQSLLGREFTSSTVWTSARRPHGLRGVYACMALQLFRWEGDPADAYVAMCILGHTGLHESLVYTTFHVGEGLERFSLGRGRYTPHTIEPFSCGDAVAGAGAGFCDADECC